MWARTSSMRMRASGSSSTTSTRTRSAGTLRLGQRRLEARGPGHPWLHGRPDMEGKPDLRHNAELRVAVEREALPASIELLEPGARVPDADAAAGGAADARRVRGA